MPIFIQGIVVDVIALQPGAGQAGGVDPGIAPLAVCIQDLHVGGKFIAGKGGAVLADGSLQAAFGEALELRFPVVDGCRHQPSGGIGAAAVVEGALHAVAAGHPSGDLNAGTAGAGG